MTSARKSMGSNIVAAVKAMGLGLVFLAPCTQLWAAQESASFSGTGRVAAGPCPGADLFTTDQGQHYELDRARIRLTPGVAVQVAGTVYPRISVCRRYAWLDVAQASEVAAAAPGTTARSAGAPVKPASKPDTVTLTIRPEDLAHVIVTIGSLAYRQDVRSVHLNVREDGDFTHFPETMAKLALQAQDVMTKVSLSVGMFKTPVFSNTTGGREANYRSLEEMRREMAIP